MGIAGLERSWTGSQRSWPSPVTFSRWRTSGTGPTLVQTYSTPLSLPFPVLVEAGHEVHQTVAIRCDRLAEVALSDTGRTGPRSVSAPTAPGPEPVPVTLSVAHVLVELDARSRSWPAALDRAAAEAGPRRSTCGSSPTAPATWRRYRRLVGRRVVRLAVHDRRTHVTEPELWEALRDARRRARAGGRAPRRSALALHRAQSGPRPAAADLPAWGFSLTPQMHARERAQLVESVAMQRLVTRAPSRGGR